MKARKVFAVFVFVAVIAITIAQGQEGFTGPGGKANSKEPRTVTVNQARGIT